MYIHRYIYIYTHIYLLNIYTHIYQKLLVNLVINSANPWGTTSHPRQPSDHVLLAADLKIRTRRTGAFYAGLLDGLLGVAGMMNLIVSQWIIPENALRLAPVRLNKPIHGRYNSITPIEMKIFQPLMTVEH